MVLPLPHRSANRKPLVFCTYYFTKKRSLHIDNIRVVCYNPSARTVSLENAYPTGTRFPVTVALKRAHQLSAAFDFK
jgi:hypothetical protein